MNKKTILILIKTVLPILVGGYLFWVFFSQMSDEHMASFKYALSEANYFWIFLSLAISWVALISRAIRWGYVLEPLGYDTPVKNRYHAMMIGYLVNFTIPRAGEASRSAMLYRSDGVPFAKSFGTIIAERAIDLLMLGSVFLLAMVVGYDDLMQIFNQITASNVGAEGQPVEGFQWKYLIYGIIGVGFIAGIVLMIFNEKFRTKLMDFIKGVLNGVLSVFKTKKPFSFIFHTVLIWVSYIAMFAVPFYSLPETTDFPLSGYLIGFIAGAVGISLTNGGFGVYPLLVGMVIAFYLKDDYSATEAEGIGKALGMLLWMSQTVFMILLGLLSLVLLPKNYTKENVKTQGSQQ